MSEKIGPLKIGGEILIELASARRSGTLTWKSGSATGRLVLKDGRPEIAWNAAGSPTSVRQDVTSILRNFVVLTSGEYSFEEGAPKVPASIGIDSFGETLVALARNLSPAQLDVIWAARAGHRLKHAAHYDRIAAAVSQVSGQQLQKPEAGLNMGALYSGASEAMQRAWIAVIVLGGLQAIVPPSARRKPAAAAQPASTTTAQAATSAVTTSPSQSAVAPSKATEQVPKTGNSEIDALLQEIADIYSVMSGQTHYEFLKIDPKAPDAEVRKGYFTMAKRFHTDRLAGLDVDEFKLKAEEIFRRAEEAQRVLSDPENRKNYDVELDRKAKGLPTDVDVIFEAEAKFRKARSIVTRGHAAKAEPLLQEIVEMNPGEPEFRLFLGYSMFCAHGEGVAEEAIGKINVALKENGKLALGHEFLGRIAAARSKDKEALRHFQKALEVNPKSSDAQREIRLIGKRLDEAQSSGGLFSKLLKR